MLMHYGVDFTNTDTDELATDFYHRWLSQMMSVNKLHSELNEHVCRYHKLLLRYGYRPGAGCIMFLHVTLDLQPEGLVELVPCMLNMMNNQHLDKFWNHAYYKMLTSQTEQLGRCGIERFYVRSLKDLCRYELYNHVAKRRMAVYVDQLPLPNALKQYLIFQD